MLAAGNDGIASHSSLAHLVAIQMNFINFISLNC